jgi:hypothetical protein
MVCLLLTLLLATIVVLVSSRADEVEPTQYLYELQATCLGSTGHSAVLEVTWSAAEPEATQPPPLSPLSLSPIHFNLHPNPLHPLAFTHPKHPHHKQSKLHGTLILIGELNMHDRLYSQSVSLATPSAHVNVPAWALVPRVFATLLLKQGGVVVGRLEFVELGALCGHHGEHEGDVDGSAHLDSIRIQ